MRDIILIITALIYLCYLGNFIYHIGYSDGWERELLNKG